MNEGNVDLDDSPLEEEKEEEEKKININKPYDELKQYNNLDKNSKEFANKWLQISKDKLNFKENISNFNSFSPEDKKIYRENLKQIHASSNKRSSNNYIQKFNNDVENQLAILNKEVKKKIEKRN